MCGIAGFLKLSAANASLSEPEATRVLESMTRCLIHRGPDEEGFLVQSPVYLGMRRLKIIDLATGQQPISNQDGTVTVVFNGEIYNYLELRAELEKKGYRFKTHSDTEVLVHLYDEEGPDFPRRLRGMFAFAIWDSKKRALVLGRDHFGIKPLYAAKQKGFFFFASELKSLFLHPAFERRINFPALDDFLTLLFVPSPHTSYEGVYKLEPGTTLTITEDGREERHTYWDPNQKLLQASALNDVDDIERRLEEKISECVKLVLRSDVPIGVFLSSGLDSTMITSFAKEHLKDLSTFTIYYPDPSYSEREGAAEVAKAFNTHHTEIPLEFPADLPSFVWKILSHFDQPFGDLSAIPTYLLCQAARRHITVALSGDGGDELFGGYPTAVASEAFRGYRHLPGVVRSHLMPMLAGLLPTDFGRVSFDYKVKRFVQGSVGLSDPLAANFSWRGAFYWKERREFYSDRFYDKVRSLQPYETALAGMGRLENVPFTQKLMLADLRVYLRDLYLVKADMVSMAHSLELRPALLDPELAELAFRIPMNMKLRGFTTKWILRRLLQKRLPPSILKMPKRGFTPPLGRWLSEKRFQDFVRDVTGTREFRELDVLKQEGVEKLLREHSSGQVDHTRRLWAVLSLASFASSSAQTQHTS